MENDTFRGYGVPVSLPQNAAAEDQLRDAFLKIRETLTRVGIPSTQSKTLCQSCHILHKKGKYAILHFKELFGIDGKPTNFSEEDRLRRNLVVSLLEDWGLLKIINPELVKDKLPLNQIKVLPYSQKSEYTLVAKYNIGGKK
jgi:hypothetical protein